MEKITTILFDFDGVIANTEPQYDLYINKLGKEVLGIDDLAPQVKGTTTVALLKKHFGHLPQTQVENIKKDLENFEEEMSYPAVEGIYEFIDKLKKEGYKIGLVTSSQPFKMKIAIQKMKLENIFGTIVTSEDVTQGKPDPMCYQIAAERLDAKPKECLVFEDSLFGLQAAKSAGMEVVRVSTTLTPDVLKKATKNVIPDFTDQKILFKIIQQRS